MKLIVGLGNPGSEYQDTRHNVGFMVIEKLAKELSKEQISWKEEEKFKALIVKIGDVILVKPITFMNSSGEAISSIMHYFKCVPSDVWIVHDDIDLPLGKIRIRQKGGTAGHNGVASILDALKSDTFVRFRMGIGRGKESTGPNENKNLSHRSVIAFVLSRFNQSEAGSLKHLVKHGATAVRIALTMGMDKAMNRFN